MNELEEEYYCVIVLEKDIVQNNKEDCPPVPNSNINCQSFSNWDSANSWFSYYYPCYGDIANLISENGILCEELVTQEKLKSLSGGSGSDCDIFFCVSAENFNDSIHEIATGQCPPHNCECVDAEVTVSTSGCCLTKAGLTSFGAVGSGTVSATSMPSGSGGCGFKTTVNGSEGSQAVNDGMGAAIGITPTGGCTLEICSSATPVSGCERGTAKNLLRNNNGKLIVDKYALNNKILSIKKNNIIKKMIDFKNKK